MPATNRRYVVVGIYWAHTPDKVQVLAINGQVVVFDTVEMARWVLPALSGGRMCHWSADQETITFSPMQPKGFNRAVIITGYDPYDVPVGMGAVGIRSEAEYRDWHSHVFWRHVMEGMLAWADGIQSQPAAEAPLALAEA